MRVGIAVSANIAGGGSNPGITGTGSVSHSGRSATTPHILLLFTTSFILTNLMLTLLSFY